MIIAGITSSSINLISQAQTAGIFAGSKSARPTGNSSKISQEGQTILELAINGSLSQEQENQLFANKIGFDAFESISNNSTKAEHIISELDTIFGYKKELSTEKEQQIGALFDQIDKIMQHNATSAPSKEQELLLDKLFGQVDDIYQARSYEGLTAPEKQQVDQLLGQLDEALV